jgi:hypothetical protein
MISYENDITSSPPSAISFTSLQHQHEQSKCTTSSQRADPGQGCSVFAILWAYVLSAVDLDAAQA